MGPQGDLVSDRETNRNTVSDFGEVGAADVHTRKPAHMSRLWVCSKPPTSRWGLREDTATGRRTRKRKQTTCLEQGISQSNQLEPVLGRHKVGSCTYTSLCSGYHCHSGPEGLCQLSRAGLGPGDLTKAEVTGGDRKGCCTDGE